MQQALVMFGGVLAVFVVAFAYSAMKVEGPAVSSIQEESATEVTEVSTAGFQEPEKIEELEEPEVLVAVPDEPECQILDDFTGTSDLRWYTVNDGVMGGLSEGFATIENNTLIHAGEIVTRGGGFSYVGTRLPSGALVGYSSLQVRLNSYGRVYAANFADSRSWRVTHQAPVPVGNGDQWQEVSIKFTDTVPTIFSRQVNSAPFDAGAVEELAFILSDGVDGLFRTEIDWVRVCR